MAGNDSGHPQRIPLEEVEERERPRELLLQARAGDLLAKRKLLELYGVRVYCPADGTGA